MRPLNPEETARLVRARLIAANWRRIDPKAFNRKLAQEVRQLAPFRIFEFRGPVRFDTSSGSSDQEEPA